MKTLYSILLFVLAGLCKIGGGYLEWQWLRENKPWWFGVIGGIILVMYGVVAQHGSPLILGGFMQLMVVFLSLWL